jgi:hypothetical protein
LNPVSWWFCGEDWVLREVVVEKIGRLKPVEGVEGSGHKVEVEAFKG